MDHDNEILKDFYNKNAVIKARQFSKLRPRGRVKDVDRAFWLFDKDNPRVIELGCGNGREAKLILRYTNNYLGIDFSETMVQLAKEKNPDANFLVMDASEFLFPSGIDVVFAFASLLHCDISRVTVVMQRAYEALNINGIIYLSLKYGKYKRILKKDSLGSTLVYFYTPELIAQMIGNKMRVIFTEVEMLWSTRWFSIVLQK